MATIWITYAWADNANQDVDFVAQELVASGLVVKLDRWNIVAGRRLWPQIERFITDTRECSAWLWYVTQNSLGSEACREEFAYALDRALGSRGDAFPIIALFPTAIERDLLPASIRIRLHVALEDRNWKERIRAAAEGCAPELSRVKVLPFDIKLHRRWERVHIEVRPRAGRWSPAFVAVPSSESNCVDAGVSISFGPSGRVPSTCMIRSPRQLTSTDGNWRVFTADHDATPYDSAYLQCVKLPSLVMFGQVSDNEHYLVDLRKEASQL